MEAALAGKTFVNVDSLLGDLASSDAVVASHAVLPPRVGRAAVGYVEFIHTRCIAAGRAPAQRRGPLTNAHPFFIYLSGDI